MFNIELTSCCGIVTISESPGGMATGTIALQVEDSNDNCPSLASDVEYSCSGEGVLSVTAVDQDGDPNSSPFTFSLVEEKTHGRWRLEPANGATATDCLLVVCYHGRSLMDHLQ